MRLDRDQLLRLRIRAQWLTGPRAGGVHQLLTHLPLQAQDGRACRLAVRVRTRGVDAAAVVRACNQERSAVRTWAMRGTLHMLAAEDVGWVVSLLGPANEQAAAGRRRQLGLDTATCDRALPLIRSILAEHGPLERPSLIARLVAAGVSIDATGQAPAHLVGLAAARGLLCRGPDAVGDRPTYVLLQDWVGTPPKPRERRAAVAELALRYLRAHGPAAPPDFASWSGLSRREAVAGFAANARSLREMAIPAGTAWMCADARVARRTSIAVRMLGAFDAYLLGYENRDRFLDRAHATRIQAGGGWIHQAVCVDGRIVGRWSLSRARTGYMATVAPFTPLAGDLIDALAAEVGELARFLGSPVDLTIDGDPRPAPTGSAEGEPNRAPNPIQLKARRKMP